MSGPSAESGGEPPPTLPLGGITAFIRARLAEWEATARAATPGPWRVERQTHSRDGGPFGHTIEPGIFDSEGGSIPPTEQDSEHIVSHDPARVLVEIEALRRILDMHIADQNDPRTARYDPECSDLSYRLTSECPTVRLLAAIWRDHPSWDPAWAPEEA